MEGFKLGKPTLVCRWRLANKELPMANRHLRALSSRKVMGRSISPALVAWTKQHIEWTLTEGAFEHPDGVLMLVCDEAGQAAMSVGAYQPLTRTSANDLIVRAKSARREAEATGVAPEDLWVVRDDALEWGTSRDFSACGASTLVDDLARTLGMPVIRKEELLVEASVKGFTTEEVFLVSDEHGIVPASDRGGSRAQKFAASYQKLLNAH